jgi:hypothetical protein
MVCRAARLIKNDVIDSLQLLCMTSVSQALAWISYLFEHEIQRIEKSKNFPIASIKSMFLRSFHC